MRNLKARPELPNDILVRLQNLSNSLMGTEVPKDVCEQRFNAARDTNWFATVKTALMDMSGETRTCMFCDHNEPTDVEHFRPKTEFPGDTFSWANMLWICATCNRLKGSKFPPHNCVGEPMINPVVDPVWNFFLLDEFGNLIKRWDPEKDTYNGRAQSTCDYGHIDREEVQTRRSKRMKGLLRVVAQAVTDLKSESATLGDINERVTEWMAEPFQADVADYYLRGPGNVTPPFSDLLALGVAVPPV